MKMDPVIIIKLQEFKWFTIKSRNPRESSPPDASIAQATYMRYLLSDTYGQFVPK